MPLDSNTAGAIIRVQLESLTQYAQELEGQLGALQSHQTTLSDSQSPRLGTSSFGEAVGLLGTHDTARAQMAQLLAEVHQGISAAAEAARQIQQEYHSTDALAKARHDDVTSRLGPDAPTPPPSDPIP